MAESASLNDRRADVKHLRDIIGSDLPQYNEGPTISKMIADICAIGLRRDGGAIREPYALELPADALVQLFPGGDLPDLPPNALLSIADR